MLACGAGAVLLPYRCCATAGYRVSLISVDLPEPETPVTHTSRPTGRSRVTSFRLLPLAPVMRSMRSGSGLVYFRGALMLRRPVRYSPVNDAGLAHTCVGVPCAIT